MPCRAPNLAFRTENQYTFREGAAFWSPLHASPPLMVSDNPETVENTPGDPLGDHIPRPAEGVLWQQTTELNLSLRHRVFAWHVNEIGHNRFFGVTIENIGQQPILIANRRTQFFGDRAGGNFLNRGLCLADALLAGTLDQYRQDETVLVGVSTPTVAQRAVIFDAPWNVGDNNMITLQMDFRVVQVPTLGGIDLFPSYILRTVYADTVVALAEQDDPPLQTQWDLALRPPAPATHARGGWRFSEIQASFEYIIPGGRDIALPARFNMPSPGTHQFTRNVSADNNAGQGPATRQGALDNRAPFGGIMRATLRVLNLCEFSRVLELTLQPRALAELRPDQRGQAGQQYAGASQLRAQGVRRIPPLGKHVAQNPNNRNTLDSAILGAIEVPPLQVSEYTLSVVCAGASTAPIALNVFPLDPCCI
jgi:hypothetical protein